MNVSVKSRVSLMLNTVVRVCFGAAHRIRPPGGGSSSPSTRARMGLGRLLLGVVGLRRDSEMKAVLGAESGGRGAGVAVRHDSICPRVRGTRSPKMVFVTKKFDRSLPFWAGRAGGARDVFIPNRATTAGGAHCIADSPAQCACRCRVWVALRRASRNHGSCTPEVMRGSVPPRHTGVTVVHTRSVRNSELPELLGSFLMSSRRILS